MHVCGIDDRRACLLAFFIFRSISLSAVSRTSQNSGSQTALRALFGWHANFIQGHQKAYLQTSCAWFPGTAASSLCPGSISPPAFGRFPSKRAKACFRRRSCCADRCVPLALYGHWSPSNPTSRCDGFRSCRAFGSGNRTSRFPADLFAERGTTRHFPALYH